MYNATSARGVYWFHISNIYSSQLSTQIKSWQLYAHTHTFIYKYGYKCYFLAVLCVPSHTHITTFPPVYSLNFICSRAILVVGMAFIRSFGRFIAIGFTPFFVNFPHKSNFLEFYIIRVVAVVVVVLLRWTLRSFYSTGRTFKRNHRKEALKWYVVCVKYIAIYIAGLCSGSLSVVSWRNNSKNNNKELKKNIAVVKGLIYFNKILFYWGK